MKRQKQTTGNETAINVMFRDAAVRVVDRLAERLTDGNRSALIRLAVRRLAVAEGVK
jgi:hypothetical protein